MELKGVKLLKTFEPRAQGRERIRMAIPQITQVLTLDQFVSSFTQARIFSNTAVIVENAANIIKAKK